MSKINNPLAPKTNRLLAKSTEIKAWVRQLLELPPDTPLTVAELACRDEGCPDIETVIGIMRTGEPIQTIRVHMTMSEVTFDHLAEAVSISSSKSASSSGHFSRNS
ncbi:nitrate reductase [Ahrensia marina]|uniref:nitrate reductase n=1 Tax=Ahrensia marina TaxID=1514904 RepID=UPI00191B3ECA|nr:nitrate reductase [Ahrensia marina]